MTVSRHRGDAIGTTSSLWQREGIPIPRTEGVRTTRWKYNLYLDGQPGYEELYDLEADPEEETNLAASPDHTSRLQELRDRHQAWKSALTGWQSDASWIEPA